MVSKSAVFAVIMTALLGANSLAEVIRQTDIVLDTLPKAEAPKKAEDQDSEGHADGKTCTGNQCLLGFRYDVVDLDIPTFQ